tara:strand:- start:110 stop:379 length:270 start_codon:yes stop_codon:yes gene_type:complete
MLFKNFCHELGQSFAMLYCSRNAVVLFIYILTNFVKFKNCFIMGFDYLFYNDLPKGLKSVCINGKRMSVKEFNQVKKEYFSKKRGSIES